MDGGFALVGNGTRASAGALAKEEKKRQADEGKKTEQAKIGDVCPEHRLLKEHAVRQGVSLLERGEKAGWSAKK